MDVPPTNVSRNAAAKSATLPLQQPARSAARVTLTIDEACASLGISRDHFERHLMRQLRIIHIGRRRLVPVRELERWVDRQATRSP